MNPEPGQAEDKTLTCGGCQHIANFHSGQVGSCLPPCKCPAFQPPSREPGQAGVTKRSQFDKHQCFSRQPHDPHHWGSLGSSWRLCPGIPDLLADRTRYQEVLRKWDDHLSGCMFFLDGAVCECGYAEARALLEVPDAK